jgi:putative MATE family efflux protein
MATMSPAATPLPRRFILFLGPLVLTNVLQALSGTFNSVFLGQMLGPQALAAAIAFFPVFMTLFAFVIGLGTGASILVGQAWGAQQTGKVRDIAGTVLLGGALLGVVIALAGWWTVPPLLRWLGTPAEVLPEAIAYAHVMLLAMPVLFLSMLAAALLRGMGDTVTPLGVLIVTCAVSAVLTPLIISGRLGLPPQGTASAAWGTLVATAVALLWLGWRLSRRQHLLAPQALRTRLRWRGDLLRPVARLGVPTGLFFITGSLADVGLMSLVNPHGASSVAAWGAAQHVTSYVQFPAMSIAIASSVFAAQAIGAGHAGQCCTRSRAWGSSHEPAAHRLTGGGGGGAGAAGGAHLHQRRRAVVALGHAAAAHQRLGCPAAGCGQCVQRRHARSGHGARAHADFAGMPGVPAVPGGLGH